MSEGHSHGEFVWCRWKLSLCDWMSSRLSLCFSAPHCVCIYIYICVCMCVCVSEDQRISRAGKFAQLLPNVFLVHFLSTRHLCLSFKNKKHIYVTADVFTAESSLDVGAELRALLQPLSRDVWPLCFHSLGSAQQRHNQPACVLWHSPTPSQLQPSRALNLTSDHFPSLLKDFEDIHSAHTYTHLKQGFRLESPGVAGHLLCSLRLGAPHPCGDLSHRERESPPHSSTTTGLKEQEIGWTLDNGPVDRLIMQLLCFLIESLHQLHFFGRPAEVNQQRRHGEERSAWSLVLWFTPTCSAALFGQSTISWLNLIFASRYAQH